VIVSTSYLTRSPSLVPVNRILVAGSVGDANPIIVEVLVFAAVIRPSMRRLILVGTARGACGCGSKCLSIHSQESSGIVKRLRCTIDW
jgi:hypothetical protein